MASSVHEERRRWHLRSQLSPASVTSIDLSNNALCGVTTNMFGSVTAGTYTAEGIIALADALRVSASSLTHIGEGGLDLRNNELGDEGWGAIFAGVCSSEASKVASIDASGNGIGPKGAKLIAEVLCTSVNLSLTKIS